MSRHQSPVCSGSPLAGSFSRSQGGLSPISYHAPFLGGLSRGGGIFRDVRAGGRSPGQVAGMGAWPSCTPCFRDAHWSLELSPFRDELGLEKDLGNRRGAGLEVPRSKGCLRGSGEG